MHRVFQAFIDGLAASGDAESLRAVLAQASAALDLSCFAYLSLPSRRGDAPELISTYPVEWTDHYLQQSYERVDPVIVKALTTPEPFEWGQEFPSTRLTKPQCVLLDEAAQFGIRCGFTVPIHDPHGSIAAVTFAANERRATFQRCIEQHRHVLQLMAMYFHAQAAFLKTAVQNRKNILVAGGTSTGKTTLVNAILSEVAKTDDRVVLIEDTRELQCAAPNLVALRTKDGAASLSDLVRSALRLRPDRIPIGEVRGGEALDLLKAWGTGHPGGIGTLHAGSAIGALRRLEQLIQEAVVTVPRALIAETIDLIAVLAGRGAARRLAELTEVKGLSPTGEYVLTPAGLP
jgi:Type II/IV secretion system protein/Autoinducer binding domain